MAKPTFRTEEHEGEVALIAQGNLNVQHADLLKDFLLQSLTRSQNERLELTEVASLDITAVQLIHLWKRILKQQGRKASIVWPDSKSVMELLENCGITKLLQDHV